jgi:RimJ/RimL family protein N-acetyltransferase
MKRTRRRIWVRRQEVFVIESPQQIVDSPAAIPLELAPVTAENIERGRDFRAASTLADFARFLRKGYLGVYAIAADRVVGHAWAAVCRDTPIKAGGYFRLKPGEALILYCNVAPEQRGRRIYPAMLNELCRRLFRETATRRILVDTEADNASSLRGIARAGFRRLGRGLYVQVMGRLVFARLRAA